MIKEITTDPEFLETFGTMHELRPLLKRDAYLAHAEPLK
jgi:hypothetical protein